MQDSNFWEKNVTMITDINNIFISQRQLENSLSWDYTMAQWVKVLGTKFDDLSSILDPTWRKKSHHLISTYMFPSTKHTK